MAHSVKTVVLDKTGTITEGKPKVTDVVPSEYISEQELLSVAASMEKPSEHPLADAIVAYAQEKKKWVFFQQSILRQCQGKELLLL